MDQLKVNVCQICRVEVPPRFVGDDYAWDLCRGPGPCHDEYWRLRRRAEKKALEGVPPERLPGLNFAIHEVEALRRIAAACTYNASYIAAIDDVLVTLRADLARGGVYATSEFA